MCGITGILSWSGEDSPTVLTAMTDALAHRGPDGRGEYRDGQVELGHRRLAIIDLTPEANQPFLSSDGRHVLSYNGELYNYRELREELRRAGVTFRTTSDTEVVLNALIQWGTEAFRRFNGMFALAWWSAQERKLVLGRDRYGVKPLYYHLRDGRLIFGSEIKAILAHPGYRTSVDLPGLLEYFTFQNFFTKHTLFKDVHLFPAGCHATFRADSQPHDVDARQYWDFSFEEPEKADDPGAYREELDRLLRTAVRRQMVSDVEVGAYLSGGLDSASMALYASEVRPHIKTFTTGFDMSTASGLEAGFDEREKSEALSRLFKTEHYEFFLKSGDMQRAMHALTFAIEEPRVGQTYPIYYTAHMASRFVKVALSGAGGDELFAGYPWRYYRAVVNDDFDHYIDKYYNFWQRLIPNTVIHKVFSPVWNEVKHVWTRDIFKDVFPHGAQDLSRPEDYVNHSLYFEAKTFLHSLLIVEDKLSMAHGLETRVPFLDNDLVDFAMKLPVAMKLGDLGEVVRLNENQPGVKSTLYSEKSRNGKRLLRDNISHYVPKEISERGKQGFSAPDATWYRGESIDYVRDVLLTPKARIYDFLDRKSVSDLVGDHLSGKENRRLLIWSLLSFEEWCHTFLH